MNYRQKSVRIADICSVQSGFTARGRLEFDQEAGRLAIQLRDLSLAEAGDQAQLPLFAFSDPVARYLVGSGDVLFRSRGEQNTAHVVGAGIKDKAVAVLPLLVLRPDLRRVFPHYLAWVINQGPAQAQLDRAARGSAMRMIPKPALEALEIPLPDAETQAAIIVMDNLAAEEQRLTERLGSLRRQLWRQLLVNRAQCPKLNQ
tara:strand:- start:1498 stop:2103 length:606 start_codon:yes stop_codon:yes gene_type:complete